MELTHLSGQQRSSADLDGTFSLVQSTPDDSALSTWSLIILLAGLSSGQQEASMRKVFEIMQGYWYQLRTGLGYFLHSLSI